MPDTNMLFGLTSVCSPFRSWKVAKASRTDFATILGCFEPDRNGPKGGAIEQCPSTRRPCTETEAQTLRYMTLLVATKISHCANVGWPSNTLNWVAGTLSVVWDFELFDRLVLDDKSVLRSAECR